MIVTNVESYNEVMDKLLSSDDKFYGVDTEGEPFSDTKFLPWELELYGVGVYCKTVKAYIVKSLLDSRFQEFLSSKKLVFHNAKFDVTFLEAHGFDMSKTTYHDTLIMSWLVNENRWSYKLKDLAEAILRVEPEKVTRFKDIEVRPEVSKYDNEKDYLIAYMAWLKHLGEYCIKDCTYTYKLCEIFLPKLEEDGLMNVYEKLELPFIEVIRSMERRGIKVDTDYLKELGDNLDKEVAAVSQELRTLMGKEIDIASPKQLREYFFTEKKYVLPDDLKTPKGEVSTNVEAMEYLAEKCDCKEAALVLRYRELSKLKSTYVVGMLELTKNGCIHASFKQTGTITGRLSSSQPNLQNIPRRDDIFNIRKAFVARPGYGFVISDYSQIELRLMAYFSKDATLVKAYQEGKDIHQATADAIGCDRHTAKTINFGLNYGRTAYGLSHGLGISVEEAQHFIDQYFIQFPGVKVFMAQVVNTVKKNYAVWTLAKRKRHFPEYVAAKKAKDFKTVGRLERQAGNSVIQGSASDVIKIAMRNLHRLLKPYDAHILVQIHDELVIECPKDKCEEVAKIVKNEMQTCVDLKTVPLVTEPVISDRWVK